jgi:hypothetical protein
MGDSSFFLCFRGDGPYWTDLVYVPAYPAGFSYSKWAFRYDPGRYVSKAVTAECVAIQQKRIQKEALLGVRFISRPELILPLRKVEVNWIDLSGGISQFYFRVQALLDFTKFTSLTEACLTLPPAEIGGEVGNTLAFRSAVEVGNLPWCQPTQEDTAWAKLLDLITSNDAIPLRAELKSATYLRLSNVLDKKNQPITAVELATSPGKGPVYGALLKEGEEYQIKLTHRILGDRAGTAPILPIKLELPTAHVQLTEPALEVLGWYQTTPIAFKAVRADKAHQILLVRAEEKKKEEQKGGDGGDPTQIQSSQSMVYLPIPLRVEIGWLYRLRTNWALRAGLAIILTLQASIAYLKEFFDKLLAGKASLKDLVDYWPVLLLMFFLGSIASILVTLLQDQTKAKG